MQTNNYFTWGNKTEFRITMNKTSEDDEGVGKYARQLPSFMEQTNAEAMKNHWAITPKKMFQGKVSKL